MPKTIQLSDDRYARLIESAQAHGFEIKAGPGSQLGAFIEWLLDTAPEPLHGDDAPELWGRFLTSILPYLNDLAVCLADQGKGLNIQSSPEIGRCLFEQFDF